MRLSNVNRNRLIAFAFLLPNLLGFLVFMLIPIFTGVGAGFFSWDGVNPAVFVGFDNFLRLINDRHFWNSLQVTLHYTVLTVPTTIVLSLIFAVLLTQKIRMSTLFRAMIFFPYIASIVAVAIVWQFLFHATLGPINESLRALGIVEPPRWLSSRDTAIYGVAIMNVWRSIGYYMILFIAGIRGIPSTLYEAAWIDGAGAWRRFWSITRPMLRPTTFFVVIISIILSFQVFSAIFIMTGGGPGAATMVLVYRIYEEAFVNSRFGYASSMAGVLFVIVLIITVIQFKFSEDKITYMS